MKLQRPWYAVVCVGALTVTGALYAGLTPDTVLADNYTISGNNARDGWDPNEPGLSPAFVGSGQFGQVFSVSVTGQQYAQPLVINSNVIASTMRNVVYSINGTTGGINWQKQLGAPEPMSIIGCSAVTDTVGILSTPVYDPTTNTIYVMARAWDGAHAASAQYQVHALNAANGAELGGWPATIAGPASNDPGTVFDPTVENQRPGLLLLGGFVYAAFASWCDNGSYKGWVSSVSTGTRVVKLWTTEAQPPSTNNFGGIWQSGGGLVSDGPGRIFVAVGNGDPPLVGPGSNSQPTMGESVVRLTANPDGTVTHADHFSPYNASDLNVADLDLGSGGPIALPDSMGVPGHPHLLIQGGKNGIVYVLDRDNLGGRAQGPGGTDLVVAAYNAFGAGVYSHPSVWPGDGGYIYLGADNEYVMRISTSGGVVSLNLVAAFANSLGFRLGSSIVTSNGTQSGSALVWSYVQPMNGGPGAELRAHLAVPTGQTLPLLWRAPVGQVNKFTVPVSANGKVYAATSDGHLIGFGPTAHWAMSVPLSGGTSSGLTGIARITGSDIWTVGSFKDAGGSNNPMTEHWDGTRWNMVVPPKAGASSVFNGIAARATNDVWAVGSYNDAAGKTWPLTEHWSGGSWAVVVPPQGGVTSTLNGVAAFATSDIWAVGSYNDASGRTWPLTYHWDGSKWNVVVPLAGGVSSTLMSVSGAASNDVWAVGSYRDAGGNTWPLAEHWNGTAWSISVPFGGGSSSALMSVAAVTSGDVWAVGWYLLNGTRWPLAEHWNGTSWSVFVGLNGGSSSTFTSVAQVASSEVWAVGAYFDSAGNPRPLAERWDGLKWNMQLPLVGGTGSSLAGVTVVVTNNVWAAGSYTDSGGAAHPLAEHFT